MRLRHRLVLEDKVIDFKEDLFNVSVFVKFVLIQQNNASSVIVGLHPHIDLLTIDLSLLDLGRLFVCQLFKLIQGVLLDDVVLDDS